MRGRRILFFADASSVHTRRWVGAMVERGFDAVVLTRRPAEVPGATDVLALRPGDGAGGWFAALPQVRRLARQLAPRWLHGHYVTSYGLWAAAARGVLDVPLVQTAWGSDLLVTPQEPSLRGRLTATLVRRNLARAELVTADSVDLLAAAQALGARGPVVELGWGADTERFMPGTPAPGFELVSLRSWEPNYRIDLVLRAFAALRRRRPGLQPVLHLLGGGPDGPALQALARELGLMEAVRFTGRVDDAAMVSTLQRARAVLSLPRSDATSVSLLEAMACALPVVVSELPANAQWVDADWRVAIDAARPEAAAEAVAERLLLLHDEPARAAALGAAHRERVVARASRRVMMDRMAALYEALARGPAALRQAIGEAAPHAG